MNIFALDNNPHMAARYHNDRHVVKMILESAQILCTAHVFLDGKETAKTRIGAGFILRPTHINHPCVKWARATDANYAWLHKLFGKLCLEYSLRYHKTHSYECLVDLLAMKPLNIPKGELQPFVQCMPDKYKRADPVLAYRTYYAFEKQHIAQWKYPAVEPHWYTGLSSVARAARSYA